MKDRVFLDTNILIYLYSKDEPEKQKTALTLFTNYQCVISMQVLNEISNVLIKKFKILPSAVIEVVKEITETCEIAEAEISTIIEALRISERYHYSNYDSLIIAAALHNECIQLFTEDMQHNQVINNALKINNIFSSDST